MLKIVLAILLSLQGLFLFSQEIAVPQSFKHLSKVELDVKYPAAEFENPAVYFDSEHSVVINRSVDSTSKFYEDYTELVGMHEFVLTHINKAIKDEYHILFDYGLSADPSFSIARKIGNSYKYIGSISGLTLYVPGNGNLYCAGHTNNYFHERKKYKLVDDSLIIVEQAFKYVGLKTTTKGLLKLYADKNQTNLVAALPIGADIEILVNDGDYYLIKTSFGLVGWWQFNGYRSELIEEIYFKGD